MFERKIAVFAAVVLMTVPLTPADVLVTKEGDRIDTDGPWEVKKNQVVFTTSEGVLSSVRLSEIDLEASELATNPPQAESNEDSDEDAKPVLVLTNVEILSAEEAAEARGDKADARGAEDQEEPEDRCLPRLTLGKPVITGKKVVFNGAVLSPQGCPGIGRIRWLWGDGTEGNSWFPAKHNYDQHGEYYLEVTARNLKGKMVTKEVVVKIPAAGSAQE